MTGPHSFLWLDNWNALAAGAFLLATFGMVATRQVQGCLRWFVIQSACLVASAVLLGVLDNVWDLLVVGLMDLAVKVAVSPWLLRRMLGREVYARREITQALNVPTSLLIALGLAVAGYFLAEPLLVGVSKTSAGVNLPIGLACLFIGLLAASVRREAVPVFLALLAMENSAFFAGLAIAPRLPLIAEVAIAFDVMILVLVVSVLTRTLRARVGTTEVGALTALKEEPRP
jgi:hydrogenase-4 component E